MLNNPKLLEVLIFLGSRADVLSVAGSNISTLASLVVSITGLFILSTIPILSTAFSLLPVPTGRTSTEGVA